MSTGAVTVNADDLRMVVTGGAADQEALDAARDRLRGAYAVAVEQEWEAATRPTAPSTGVRARHGAPYTRHGHLVHGFTPEGYERPTVVARCGGEPICGDCATDASRIRFLEGVGTPRLGYATGMQLIEELAARIELGDVPPTTRGNLMTAVGDLKEAIAKGAPVVLTSRPANP